MANMSYCRFENTVSDLADCQEALRDVNIPRPAKSLSKEEYRAMKSLVEICKDIASDFEDIEFGDWNEDDYLNNEDKLKSNDSTSISKALNHNGR